MARNFDGEFITPIVKLISININFLDTIKNGVLSFCQIKIYHIFIWRHFIKFNSHQPYGSYVL